MLVEIDWQAVAASQPAGGMLRFQGNAAMAIWTDPITRLHADMETLVESSGAEWTILRADTIASNALGWAGQIRATGVVRGPDIAPTAVVHEGDIAALAVRTLTDHTHAGRTHTLTGPRVLTRNEQVQALGESLGLPLLFEAMPIAVARERMLADGRPPALVEALLASAESRPPSHLITTTVADLTGVQARDFRAWAGPRPHGPVPAVTVWSSPSGEVHPHGLEL